MNESPKRVAILTSGGDCPGINAVIRAVVKSTNKLGWECVGIRGGFEGLLTPVQFTTLDYRSMDGILNQGGTILGTTDHGRFSTKDKEGHDIRLPKQVIQEVRQSFEMLELGALVCIGGDGSMAVAQQLFEHGLPVVGVPKTIDNDLDATVITFGFDSAVATATDALDRLNTTSASQNQVAILEVTGRQTGWIALHSGIAGGADIILIPEIPFQYETICQKITEREKDGTKHTVIVTAEGAFAASEKPTPAGAGHPLATEIQKRTGKETHLCVLGNLQRGGGPTTFDRLLCTRFGVKAVQLIAEKQFGSMVALNPPHTSSVKISEAVGRIKTVPPQGEVIQTARDLGISFGD